MKNYNIKAFLIRIALFFLCPKHAILDLNIARNNERKFEAFIFFRKRGIRLFKKLSANVQWKAYMERNGLAYYEYSSTTGDINYHTLDVSLDKYMSTGKSPENVCYRLLKKLNIHPDVFIVEQKYYYETKKLKTIN